MDSPQHEAHETTDHSNLTKIRLAVRREKKNGIYRKMVTMLIHFDKTAIKFN